MSRLRTDRLATLYLFRPLQRYMIGRQEPRIPILMYHSVSENKGKRVRDYYDVHTSPVVFAEHIRLIHRSGYRVVGLDQVIRQMESPGGDSKLLAITFDDGF